MKVNYDASIKEQYLKRKKTVHISLSPVRHRVLKAQVALHNTSIQAFLEEVCGLICEEDEYIMNILKRLSEEKAKRKTKSRLVKEEKDEIYKYIEEQS
tara:strand:+ start:3274 stop:3567 length:294 start_codon:yes stop_codon:yes gene_type:complete